MPVALDLGLLPYSRYQQLLPLLTEARRQNLLPDLLLFAVHPPVITLGRQSQPDEIRWNAEQLEAAELPLVEVGRGGHTTYHGPDQQMLYPVVRLELGRLHPFLAAIHEALALTASALGVTAWRRDGFPGLWTARGKLASIGLAVQGGVTTHGIALNCEPATSGGFEAIVPCGIPEIVMTDLQTETGQTLSRFAVRSALATTWELAHGTRVEAGSFDLLPPAAQAMLAQEAVGRHA